MRNWGYKALRLIGIKTHRSFRLTLRAIALMAGLYAAFRVSMLLEKSEFESALYVYIVVIVASFVEFVIADVIADRSFPFDTERKLALMEKRLGAQVIETIAHRLSELISEFRGCDNSLISAAVHVFAELTATADQRIREGLLQLTDYIGPASGNKGRITLINQGVIGRCARTGRMETVDFADEEEYQEAMVRDFGFTTQEAERHTKTARSYLAFPLHHNDKIVGVLYFFTRAPKVFPRAADVTRLEDVAREIVNYMKLAQLI